MLQNISRWLDCTGESLVFKARGVEAISSVSMFGSAWRIADLGC